MDRAVIETVLDDRTVMAIFELQDDGYSIGEIADMLTAATGRKHTESSVKSRMSRARTAARQTASIAPGRSPGRPAP